MFSRGKPRRVAILGCGPAGMFAAHAFVESGWDVTIYSRRVRSQMFGAQYLHQPIPGLPEIKRKISYELIGTPEQYQRKVYGDTPMRKSVSPALLLGQHDAWDIRAAYFTAYEKYEHLIVNVDNISAYWYGLQFHQKDAPKWWGMVVSTVPATALCGNESHNFHSRMIWAAGDAPELGRRSPISCAPDKVICNGSNDRAWYRLSNVFGHTTVEWPYDRKPPISGIAKVEKPLWHNCDCHGKSGAGTRAPHVKLHRLGRYGAWQKGFLSHQAYVGAARLAERGEL